MIDLTDSYIKRFLYQSQLYSAMNEFIADCLINWVFYVVSMIFQLYNGGKESSFSL